MGSESRIDEEGSVLSILRNHVSAANKGFPSAAAV